ncbi:hypothetical protein D9M71_572090 [compost metagenome]
MRDERLVRDGRGGLEHDDGMHRLAPLVAGDADHRALGDGRVTGQGGFDFRAVYVLATADDHVFQAVADIHEAIVVHVAAVAGMHPASLQGLGAGFRFFPVTGHHVGPAHDDLADCAARYLTALVVDDAHLGAGGRLPGGIHLAAGLVLDAVVLAAQRGGHRCQLGHAVSLEELRMGEGLPGPLEQRRGDGRGPVVQPAQ